MQYTEENSVRRMKGEKLKREKVVSENLALVLQKTVDTHRLDKKTGLWRTKLIIIKLLFVFIRC